MNTNIEVKGLNRDVIKYIAMVTMFLNHFATALLEPGTALYIVFEDIGYFTAVTMCYFLVEGYGYTHSKSKYALRLFLFGLISQVPYVSALHFYQMNMMFSLLICLFILMAMERIKNPVLKGVSIFSLVLLSVFSDWGLIAPAITIMFAKCKGSKKKEAAAYGMAFLIFFGMNLLMYSSSYSMGQSVLYGLFAGAGILVSGAVILCFYNGKRMEKGRNFSKWFFYIFYPAHLILLWLMVIGMNVNSTVLVNMVNKSL